MEVGKNGHLVGETPPRRRWNAADRSRVRAVILSGTGDR